MALAVGDANPKPIRVPTSQEAGHPSIKSSASEHYCGQEIRQAMPSRFVILHHRVNGGEHWDLMLEHGFALATWQLSRQPTTPADLPVAANRIGDHRRAYLDYEGSISGDRGEVRRVDAGTVEWLKFSSDACVFELQGNRLRGRFRLIAQTHGWILESA